MVEFVGEEIAAIKEYLLRAPKHGRRHVLVTTSGCSLIVIALLFAGLPQIVRLSLFSIGVLNVFLGAAELVPEDRVRLAGTLRVAAYVFFLAGLLFISIVLIAASR